MSEHGSASITEGRDHWCDEYELAAMDAARAAAEHLIRLVKLADLWRLGDGAGAWVHKAVNEAAVAAGLRTLAMQRADHRAIAAERKAAREARRAERAEQ